MDTDRRPRTPLTLLALLAALALLTLAPLARSQPDAAARWRAPAYAARKKNPIPRDAASIERGHALYSRLCQACHGEKGKGDGPAGKYLRPPAADLTSRWTRSQRDGELFWKIQHGKTPMPSFRGQLDAKQTWDLVNFLRSLAPPIEHEGEPKEREGEGKDDKD